MNLNIKTTNIEMTPAIRDYFEKKLRMLGRFIDFDRDNVYVQAELGKTTQHHRSGDVFRAEINLKIGGDSYRMVSEKDDLYAAIDEAKDELGDAVQAGKKKKMSLVRRGAQRLKHLLRFGKNNGTS